jgi:hypothetical protein
VQVTISILTRGQTCTSNADEAQGQWSEPNNSNNNNNNIDDDEEEDVEEVSVKRIVDVVGTLF